MSKDAYIVEMGIFVIYLQIMSKVYNSIQLALFPGSFVKLAWEQD